MYAIHCFSLTLFFYEVLCYGDYSVNSAGDSHCEKNCPANLTAHDWYSIPLKNWRWVVWCLMASGLPARAWPQVLCSWDWCSPRKFTLDVLLFTNFSNVLGHRNLPDLLFNRVKHTSILARIYNHCLHSHLRLPALQSHCHLME